MPCRLVLGFVFLCVALPSMAEEKHLRYLPSDTKAVLTIHFSALGEQERVGGLELFQQLYRTHLAPELGDEARLPLKEVSRVVIAMPYTGSFNGVILVTGKVDAPLLDQQMDRVARNSSSLSVERMGKPEAPVYSRAINEKALLEMVPPLEKVPQRFRRLVAPSEAHVVVLDESTLMTSLSGKKQIDRALRVRGSNRLRVSEELGSVLKKQFADDVTTGVLTDDSLHPGLALVSPEEVRETFNQFDHVSLRIIGGKTIQFIVEIQGKSSNLGETLEVKFRNALKELHKLLPTLMPNETKRAVLEELLKSFQITRDKEYVKMVGTITATEWQKVTAPDK